MKKTLFLSSLLAFLLLIAYPHYFTHKTLLAENIRDLRNNSSESIRTITPIDRAETESLRDRQQIVCGQKVPSNPRESRGEELNCPPEPTTPPSNPTPQTQQPTVTQEPGRGGDGSVGGSISSGESGSENEGGESESSAVAQSAEVSAAPSVRVLAATSGESEIYWDIVRLIGILWLLISGKNVVSEVRKQKFL